MVICSLVITHPNETWMERTCYHLHANQKKHVNKLKSYTKVNEHTYNWERMPLTIMLFAWHVEIQLKPQYQYWGALLTQLVAGKPRSHLNIQMLSNDICCLNPQKCFATIPDPQSNAILLEEPTYTWQHFGEFKQHS